MGLRLVANHYEIRLSLCIEADLIRGFFDHAVFIFTFLGCLPRLLGYPVDNFAEGSHTPDHR